MATNSSRPVPDYRRFRPIFAVIVGVVWFVLLFGLGFLIAVQLPGESLLPFRFAWRFFLVGFFSFFLISPTTAFISFFQQYLNGAFTLPSTSALVASPMTYSLNPWRLGLQRLTLYWIPAVLLA